MWINEAEIDEALEVVRTRAPEYLPYVKYLSDWRDTVNSNSDGWPYWTAGTRCASRLMELTAALMNSIRGYGGREVVRPTGQEFAKALPPIKACATRHKLPVPLLRTGEEGEPGPSETFTNPKKLTVTLTAGEIEAIQEALQTTREVLDREFEDTGDTPSDHDKRLMSAMDRAASKLDGAR